jgi:hypothetical protein
MRSGPPLVYRRRRSQPAQCAGNAQVNTTEEVIMLGRKDYTDEEIKAASTAMYAQLAAYKKLASAVDKSTSDSARSALETFEPIFLNNLILALDRFFVHRVRMVTGKDGNPLNEVELLVDSLMNNDGVLRGNNVIKLTPEDSVLKLNVGDRITLTSDDFERLCEAFLAEVEAKFS